MKDSIGRSAFWVDVLLLAMLSASVRAAWIDSEESYGTFGRVLKDVVACSIGVVMLQGAMWLSAKRIVQLNLATCIVVSAAAHNFWVAKNAWRHTIGMKNTIETWPSIFTYVVPIVVIYGFVIMLDKLTKTLFKKH